MKLVFASISFCLLLLPVVGRGQGIVIDENAKRNESLDYESRHTQRNRYRLENAEIYKKNTVREVELFQKGYGLRFMLRFSNDGRIIKKRMDESRAGFQITDSIFEINKVTVIDSFFDQDGLIRIDMLEINNRESKSRNNKIVRYDKVRYKSYKSGRYLNMRNDYYRNLLENVTDLPKTTRSSHQWPYYPQKRIDGNFDPVERLIYRRRAQPYKKPLLNRRTYESKTFYPTQLKITYQNISGDSVNKPFSLLAKSKIKFFVRGEDFDENDYCFDFGSSWSCGHSESRQLTPINTENQIKNNRGLIDTIFTITYYEQAKDKPCVKPADVNFTEYLRGYSGVPVKSIQYYYRYEYFDE